VVDDEHSVCLSLREYLEDMGFEVASAESGEEALVWLNKHRPDLMIVDIRLPGMDGTTLIERVNTLHPGINFIIHTGSASFFLPENLKKIGLSSEHVLIKPVRDLNIFSERIDQILKKKA
jgi:DNA-binding NtrC family response regulator